MKLKFKNLVENVNQFDDGRIEYKDFEIVPFNYTIEFAGDKQDVSSVVIVFKQKARLDNGELMDVVAYCENEAGMVIDFNTIDEAKEYLDRYEGLLKLVQKYGELHLVPKTSNEEL